MIARELCTEKPYESLNEWRNHRAGHESRDDFADNGRPIEAEDDELAPGKLGGHPWLDGHRITRVALDESLDGIVVSSLDHRARRHTGGAKLVFEQLAKERRGRHDEGHVAQLLWRNAPLAGERMLR